MKATTKRSAVAAFLAAVALPASAQEPARAAGSATAAKPPAADVPAFIEEIVITARRREEGLQDVPISVTAVASAELESRQVYSVDQLGSVVPNLQFDQAAPSSGSSSVGQIFIRGIGQTDYTPVTDPGVAMYVDGVYLGRSPGNVLDLVDIDRVEVLRGPQGTLFGRNAIGGAIKVHSNRPVPGDTSRSLRLRAGNDSLYEMTLKANLPLGPDLAGGVALNRITRDGYVERPADGVRTGDRDRWALRGALAWNASADFDAFLVVDHTQIDENGAPTVSGGVNDRQPFATFGNAVLGTCTTVNINPNFDGTPAGGPPTFPPPGAADGSAPGCVGADSRAGPFVSEATFPVTSQIDSSGAALELNWRLSDTLQLKSTTGYRSMTMLSSRDGDNTPANIFATRDDYDHEQVSQELQLEFASRGGRFSGLAGLFYFDESGFNLVDVTVPTGALRSGGFYDNRSYAAFLHASLEVTERLSVSLGARHTEDRKAYLPDQFALGDASAGSEPGFFPPTWPELAGLYLPPSGPLAAGDRILDRVRSREDFDHSDVSADASYALNDDIMTYLRYSTGYKSGGFDQRFVGPTPDRRPSVYRPETVSSIEAGIKASALDGRLRMNLALFDADYDDLQIIVRESFNPLTRNAGRASVRGGELEIAWLPGASWELSLAAGHIDAEYRRLTQLAQDSGVRLGNQLVNAPAWSLNAGGAYRMPVGVLGTLTTRLDWSWQDEQFHDAVNSAQIRQPSFHLLNASLELRALDERWRVSLASRNLLDETYLITGNSAFDTAAAYVEQVYGRPRELLLTLDYEF